MAYGRLILLAGLLLPGLGAEVTPVFLGTVVAGTETQPQQVFAGRKQEFILTLTSAVTEIPALSGALAVVAGGLAAPLFSNRAMELQPADEVRAGVQRFKFTMEIPAAEKRQNLVLRLRVRTSATETWLPLPVVMLEVSPVTWKAVLHRFAQQMPVGLLAGGTRLAGIFQQAEVAVTETALGDVGSTGARVWFAEAADEAFRLPESAPAPWVIFKPNVRGGVEIRRPAPGAAPCVIVDASVLAGLDADAPAQELFERALATALTLTSPDSIPSQP